VACRDREEERADVLFRDGPSAWASATTNTSASVRGSGPPPTTTMEGGTVRLKIGRAVPAWQTLLPSPFDLDASLLPPDPKGPGAGAPVLVG
jgi:hypothetical protein